VKDDRDSWEVFPNSQERFNSIARMKLLRVSFGRRGPTGKVEGRKAWRYKVARGTHISRPLNAPVLQHYPPLLPPALGALLFRSNHTLSSNTSPFKPS
jgi:hypothetical protein